MINVKVKLFLSKNIVGEKAVELRLWEGCTVNDVLLELTKRYGNKFSDEIFDPETGEIRPYYRVLVSGCDFCLLGGLETHLNNDDVISIFPPLAGG